MMRWTVGLLALTLSMGLLSGCGATGTGPAKPAAFKVGLVTDMGGLNDHSFNHLAYVGLMQAKRQLGVTTAVAQSRSASDYVPFLSSYAEQGYNLVIAVGFLMQQAVQQVAQKYPHTRFMIIDDDVPGPNIASAVFDSQQCGYLVGQLAGLVQEDHALPHINNYNTLGVVGGMAIPPVEAYIAGFEAGVKSVDPAAEILLKYAGNLDNPGKGSTVAQTMIARHADIIFQLAGGSGLGVIKAAREAGVYAIGSDDNQSYLAPGTVITSAEKGVNVAAFDIIKETLDGRFKAGLNTFDLANNGVGYATPIAAIPKSIVDRVEKTAQAVEAGKIQPPAKLSGIPN